MQTETRRPHIVNAEPKRWAVEFYKTTPDNAELIHTIEVDTREEAFAIAARNQAQHGDLILCRERRDIYLEEYVLDPGVFHWCIGADTEVDDGWIDEAFA